MTETGEEGLESGSIDHQQAIRSGTLRERAGLSRLPANLSTPIGDHTAGLAFDSLVERCRFDYAGVLIVTHASLFARFEIPNSADQLDLKPVAGIIMA